MLERVFNIDLQHSLRCVARDRKILAAIFKQSVVLKILTAWGWRSSVENPGDSCSYMTRRTLGKRSNIAATTNEASTPPLPTTASLSSGGHGQFADVTASAPTMSACTMKAP